METLLNKRIVKCGSDTYISYSIIDTRLDYRQFSLDSNGDISCGHSQLVFDTPESALQAAQAVGHSVVKGLLTEGIWGDPESFQDYHFDL